MKIRRDHEYVHGLETVYAMFTDAGEIEAKHEALGARNISIEECEIYEDGADVRFIRELPAEVPGVLSKFLQPWNTVTQFEQWRSTGDGGYDADLDIDIANVPVTISGSLNLEPVDGGCVNHVRLAIECSIPLVGRTLAEFIGKDCKRLVADEYKYITQRLAGGS
jgi:hypothetical protein